MIHTCSKKDANKEVDVDTSPQKLLTYVRIVKWEFRIICGYKPDIMLHYQININ